MHIAVCDDDTNIHDIVKSYLDEYNISNRISNIKVNAFVSGESLLEYYSIERRETIDIVFMDIEMDKFNGIETIRKLQQRYNNLIIIFITNHINYAPETFRVGAFQLLTKPISKKDFFNDYSRAIDKYQQLHKEFIINWKGTRTIVEFKDIYYIEAYNRHLFIHTKTEDFECVGKLSDYEKVLNLSGFVRTHQSFIVNIKYIKSITFINVILENNIKVYMSKHKRKEVMSAFSEYAFR